MPICEVNGCLTESSFNYKGLPRKFCSKHKQLNMINVKDFICQYDNCLTHTDSLEEGYWQYQTPFSPPFVSYSISKPPYGPLNCHLKSSYF